MNKIKRHFNSIILYKNINVKNYFFYFIVCCVWSLSNSVWLTLSWAQFFLRPNQNEYIFIYSTLSLLSYGQSSYLMRVDAETDKMISHENLFNKNILSFINVLNNINIYFFSYYLIVEKNGKKNTLEFAIVF